MNRFNYQQSQAKVAVYIAVSPSAQEKRQQLNEAIAIALFSLGALVAFWGL